MSFHFWFHVCKYLRSGYGKKLYVLEGIITVRDSDLYLNVPEGTITVRDSDLYLFIPEGIITVRDSDLCHVLCSDPFGATVI